MQVRVLTLRFDPVLGGLDDTALRDFVKDKQVISVSDHLFTHEGAPYLALVVTYNPAASAAERPDDQGAERAARQRREEEREKWRKTLEEADWPLFNTLRDWRNETAREEGVPPYVVCTNRQLAEVAHRRPDTLSGLSAIEGMGRAKVERYGEAILAVVAPAEEEGPKSAEQAIQPARDPSHRAAGVPASRPNDGAVQ